MQDAIALLIQDYRSGKN